MGRWSGRKVLGPPVEIEQPGGGLAAPVYGDPRDYNVDNLGLGAMENERQRDRETELANRELARMHGSLVSFSNLGPLPDYRWKAFTGALHDKADEVGMENPNALPESRFGAQDIYGGTTATGSQRPIFDVERYGGYDGMTAANQALSAMKKQTRRRR